MTATTRLPARLDEHEYVVVTCSRDTKELTVVTPDQESHDLGSFWDSSERAVPYLAAAFGGGSAGRTLAEQAVTTAFNFGSAIVDFATRLITSVLPHDPRADEAAATKKIFAAEQHVMDRTDRHDWPGLIVEPSR